MQPDDGTIHTLEGIGRWRMERFRTHLLGLGLVIALFLGSLACSHTPVGPPPLPPDVRQQLGRIGVAYQGSPALVVYARPLRGAGQGARNGAGAALGGIVQMVSGGGDPRGMVGLIILSPAIVGVGALIGAVVAPSAAAVEEAETVLDRAVADPDLPVAVRNRILEAVQRQRPQAVLLLPEPDADAGDEVFAQAARSREGIDTVLAVSGPTITLGKAGSAGNINPALLLSVSVSYTVMRTADRALLYTYVSEYRGKARTFTVWAADNAQPLREELDRASDRIAKQIAAQLFGSDAFPETGPEVP